MTRVFFTNLTPDVTETDILDAFKPCGHVRKVKLLENCGFVYYKEEKEAIAAVRDLKGLVVNGTQLQLHLESNSPERKDYHHRRGERKDFRRGGYHYKHGGYHRGGHHGHFKPGRPRGYNPELDDRKIIVKNLSSRTRWQDLRHFMQTAGEVLFTKVFTDHSRTGFVIFKFCQDMDKALRSLNGRELDGRSLYLEEYNKSKRFNRPSRSRSPRKHEDGSRSPRRHGYSRSPRRRSEGGDRSPSSPPHYHHSSSRRYRSSSGSGSPPRRRSRSSGSPATQRPRRRSLSTSRSDGKSTHSGSDPDKLVFPYNSPPREEARSISRRRSTSRRSTSRPILLTASRSSLDNDNRRGKRPMSSRSSSPRYKLEPEDDEDDDDDDPRRPSPPASPPSFNFNNRYRSSYALLLEKSKSRSRSRSCRKSRSRSRSRTSASSWTWSRY